ncbi:hypothetical protein [Blattabacterium cuenoti]|uniref:hypothetical protein n=1 Tax=Blattabacterium cuenoti TaxID=1653831 RepID=UPI00163BC85E|nr:hypothetical protein [Blattabacterium cuenoti]
MNIIKNIFILTIYIFFLVLIQILFFEYPIFLNECISIIFILTYPYKWNKYIFLIFSSFIGFFIDCFMNTIGIHMFSTTLLAFIRLDILIFFDGKNCLNSNRFSIYNLSFLKKFFYIFSLIIMHDMSLLILELLNESAIFNKIFFLKRLSNSIFTAILCIIYFFFRKN